MTIFKTIHGDYVGKTAGQDMFVASTEYGTPGTHFIRKFSTDDEATKMFKRVLTRKDMDSAYIANVAANEALIRAGKASAMKPIELKDKIVVVVGSGASIEGKKEIFERLNNNPKFVVVALNAAADYIYPHYEYAATIDWLGNDVWFQKANKNTKIIATMSAKTLGNIKNIEFIYYSAPQVAQTAFKMPLVDSCVMGTYIFTNLFWRMGCRNFVYFGQEHCAVGGHSHIKEKMSYEKYKDMRLVVMPDINNDVQITTKYWLTNVKILEVMTLVNEDCKFYNATNCGFFNSEAPNYKNVLSKDVESLKVF